MRLAFFILLFLSASSSLVAQNNYTPTKENLEAREWFEDAKFGIFIHWGLYSVPAYSPTARDNVGVYERYAEWYWKRWQDPSKTQHFFTDFHNKAFGPNVKYQDFTQQFKAELFQPDEWAKLFKSIKQISFRPLK